jgi:hypothetical protein
MTLSSNHKLTPMRHISRDFKLGEKVIWLKRIPGGDYVYPVSATVLASTAKRIKIEADDDGQIVVRYVPPESLQRRG